jgi:hypothetical protein
MVLKKITQNVAQTIFNEDKTFLLKIVQNFEFQMYLKTGQKMSIAQEAKTGPVWSPCSAQNWNVIVKSGL